MGDVIRFPGERRKPKPELPPAVVDLVFPFVEAVAPCQTWGHVFVNGAERCSCGEVRRSDFPEPA